MSISKQIAAKSCVSYRKLHWRKTHANDQKYNISNKGKKRAKKYRQSIKGKEAAQRYYENNKEKFRARWTIHNHIYWNKLVTASLLICARCNKQATEYHHSDYSKKSVVIPLCRKCRVAYHQQKTG